MTLTAAALILCGSASAWAQMPNRFALTPLNFDLWCQETAKIEVTRCDRRMPEDMKRFEEYRAVIERYEIPYLQEKENKAQLNRTILHGDPVGNPLRQNPGAQSQQPTQPKAQDAP
jgi:hypothetical protein